MWGWAGFLFFYLFGNFFQHVKKLPNFWNFVKIKVAKFKLNHMYGLKLHIRFFLIGPSEKSGIEIESGY